MFVYKLFPFEILLTASNRKYSVPRDGVLFSSINACDYLMRVFLSDVLVILVHVDLGFGPGGVVLAALRSAVLDLLPYCPLAPLVLYILHANELGYFLG